MLYVFREGINFYLERKENMFFVKQSSLYHIYFNEQPWFFCGNKTAENF